MKHQLEIVKNFMTPLARLYRKGNVKPQAIDLVSCAVFDALCDVADGAQMPETYKIGFNDFEAVMLVPNKEVEAICVERRAGVFMPVIRLTGGDLIEVHNKPTQSATTCYAVGIEFMRKYEFNWWNLLGKQLAN